MTTRIVDVRGRKVELLEAGSGQPVLYLHDMWDVHTAQGGMFPFHEQLAGRFHLMAPAHPGCGESTGIKDIIDIEDLAFHYLDLLDALDIRSATVLGVGLGGWIATEMAVRNPERIGRMALVGAAGLQAPDALIADVFMYSQHRDGGIMQELREILFKDHRSELAHAIIPDGRTNIPDEVRRYKSLTIAGRVGWEPPYLHNRRLAARLHRVTCPTQLLWGAHDRFVPVANGHAYAQHIANSALATLPSGHSVLIEQPRESLEILAPFLETGALTKAS
jgi:pimeloyl-ACP methyl ester carboxylesterase